MKRNGDTVTDISVYQKSEQERTFFNPYLDEVLHIVTEARTDRGENPRDRLIASRRELIEKYSFSIPTIDSCNTIAFYSPIIEIGAGSGYWAMCLAQCGADVVAYDKLPPSEGNPWELFSNNQWFNDVWHTIIEGDESTASFYPERALFLNWPPFDDPMAYLSLEYYINAGGTTVIFLGDVSCSAESGFYDRLRSLEPIEQITVPGWPGCREELLIYRRRTNACPSSFL